MCVLSLLFPRPPSCHVCFFSLSLVSFSAHHPHRRSCSLSSVFRSGAAGKVYEGLYRGLSVAIKVLKTIDDSALEEFRKEFQVLSVLKHPHIVAFFGGCLTVRECATCLCVPVVQFRSFNFCQLTLL